MFYPLDGTALPSHSDSTGDNHLYYQRDQGNFTSEYRGYEYKVAKNI